jgi:leucyl/phenylalanyl-tRNA--protein transferase
VVIPGQERFSRRTLRALRSSPFEIRADTCFPQVIQACATVPRAGQAGTWITWAMRRAYESLHRAGYAHSFEAFRDGRLVGGLYGLSLGSAFFGESMFALEPYASRAAFRRLCQTARAFGFTFIDGQVPNANLADLGALTLPREAFRALLEEALQAPTRLGPWTEAVAGLAAPEGPS